MYFWLGVLILGVVLYLGWGIVGMVSYDLGFAEAFLDFGLYSVTIFLTLTGDESRRSDGGDRSPQ